MAIGQSPEAVDDQAVSDDAFAEMMGFELDANEQKSAQTISDDDSLPTREELWVIVKQQAKQLDQQQTHINQLTDRVDELEDDQERATQSRQDLAKNTTNAKDDAEKAREIAKSASATANQLKADLDDNDDKTATPPEVEESTSPLDFFANCTQYKVKQMFSEKNKKNAFRAIVVAKRWDEFATRRADGSGVFWTRTDLKEALTAIEGEKPHGTTVTRVWEKLVELGGHDVTEATRQVSRRQEKKEIIAMDLDAAERLLESRYVGLDLVETTDEKTITGGVTPVVTRGKRSTV